MVMRSPMYKNNKRKKELMRQKKQEEKRLRRQNTVKDTSLEAERPETTKTESESPGDTPDVTVKTED